MAADPITATNLANYIPAIWSKEVLADVEANLVAGALCDRSYEGYVSGGGNKIVVPHLAEISAAAVNTATDMTLYDAVQNATNIDIDQKYDIGVLVDDINKMQTNPKYFDKVRAKLAYGLSKQIDTSVTALYNAFSQSVGTEGTALTETQIIDAYEYLNEANAPASDRAWVFDPESITDLLGRDFFVKMDYVPDSVVKNGFQGRQIFGSPVYMTTNLEAINTNYHGAAYLHKEAIALVVQLQPKFEVARIPLRHGDAIIGLCVWGVKEMRDTFGVWIKTRS